MTPAQILKEQYVATKIDFQWWNSRRKVEDPIKDQMASAVEAESESLTANKLLYNPRLPAIKAINSLRSTIKDYWERSTIPYGSNTVRLLPKADVNAFNTEMQQYAQQLRVAAYAVNNAREEILADAKKRLHNAFNPGNYPLDLSLQYDLEWSFPSVEPSADLPAHIFEQQKLYAQAKLEEAVALTEQAFAAELTNMVKHLGDCLQSGVDGKPKIFRDSAVANLTAFFERFKHLNVSSNDQLDQLVAQAQKLIVGIGPNDLRQSGALRHEIAQGMQQITTQLETLTVARPRRRIVMPTGNGVHTHARNGTTHGNQPAPQAGANAAPAAQLQIA